LNAASLYFIPIVYDGTVVVKIKTTGRATTQMASITFGTYDVSHIAEIYAHGICWTFTRSGVWVYQFFLVVITTGECDGNQCECG
jgi:DMSO reductase anchor subunit